MKIVPAFIVAFFCALLSTGAAHAQTSRIFSTAAVTRYVDAVHGSDSNDGSSPASAMQTINYAVQYLRSFYDAPQMFVQLAASEEYDQSVTCMGDGPGSPGIGIVGDPAHPEQYYIVGSLSARDKCILSLSGLQVAGPSGCGQDILADQEGVIDVDHLIVSACPGGADFQVNDGGYINFTGPITLYGNPAYVYSLNHGGTITTRGATITIPNNIAVTDFVYNVGGHFLGDSTNYAGTGAGAGTFGGRWLLTGCGTLTGGSLLPGTTGGGVSGCGQAF